MHQQQFEIWQRKNKGRKFSLKVVGGRFFAHIVDGSKRSQRGAFGIGGSPASPPNPPVSTNNPSPQGGVYSPPSEGGAGGAGPGQEGGTQAGGSSRGATVQIPSTGAFNPGLPATPAQAAQVLGWTNVVSFGADPTGVADSTTAINNAIAALTATKNVLFFPPGSYTISSALTALPSNCSVIGSGEFTSVINAAAGSYTVFSMNNPTTSISNIAINGATSVASTGISMNASQATVSNVSIANFSNGITMTSSATYGNVFNVFIQSSTIASIAITVAGNDTLISGCEFVQNSGTLTGMQCNASDRFAVTDCIFKLCNLGLTLGATSATGSTSFSGCAFDACVTAIGITPAAGQTVSNIALVGFTIDAATTGISIAPSSTGVVTGVDCDGVFLTNTTAVSIAPAGTSNVQGFDLDGLMNGCTTGITFTGASTATSQDFDIDVEMIGFTTGIQFTPSATNYINIIIAESIFDTSVASATCISVAPTSTGIVKQLTISDCTFRPSAGTSNGIVFNGVANSIANVVVDGCQFFCVGATNVGVTYTAGAVAGLQIVFVNCVFGSTTQASPVPGANNTQGQWVFRSCVGINPVGAVAGWPAAAVGPTTNQTGVDLSIYFTTAPGGTGAGNLQIGGTSIGAMASVPQSIPIRLPVGQTTTLGTAVGGSVTQAIGD